MRISLVNQSATDFTESTPTPIGSMIDFVSQHTYLNNVNVKRPQDISSPFHTPEQTTPPNSQISGIKKSLQNLNLVQNAAKIVARKPAVFDGKGNIDDWIESMKAFFAFIGSTKLVINVLQSYHELQKFNFVPLQNSNLDS